MGAAQMTEGEKQMRKLKHMLVLGLTAGALLVGPMTAQAAEANLTVDVLSAYVFRGVTVNEDTVVQPAIDVFHESGVGFNVWGNFDIGDYDGQFDKREFSEVDLTVYYSFTCPFTAMDVTLGYSEFLYPGQTVEDDEGETVAYKSDREFWLSAEKEVVSGLTLGLYGAGNARALKDYYYFNASAAYGLDVTEALSLGLKALIGYAGKDFAAVSGGTDDGFNEYQVSLNADLAVTESLSVGALIAYTDNVDDDVLPDQDTDLYGGVTVNWAF